jgi:hypothetical protein
MKQVTKIYNVDTITNHPVAQTSELCLAGFLTAVAGHPSLGAQIEAFVNPNFRFLLELSRLKFFL